MYYEFTLVHKNGKVSIVTVERQEYNDQLAYCREGVSAGWLLDYDYETVIEEY